MSTKMGTRMNVHSNFIYNYEKVKVTQMLNTHINKWTIFTQWNTTQKWKKSNKLLNTQQHRWISHIWCYVKETRIKRLMGDSIYMTFKIYTTLEVTSGYFDGRNGDWLEGAWERLLGNENVLSLDLGDGYMDVHICTNSLGYIFKICVLYIMEVLSQKK